jgi:hypothetical protein
MCRPSNLLQAAEDLLGLYHTMPSACGKPHDSYHGMLSKLAKKKLQSSPRFEGARLPAGP